MAQERDTFWNLERINRRKTALLVLVFILIYCLIGAAFDFILNGLRLVNHQLIGFPTLTIAATAVALAQALRAYYMGSSVLLGAVGALDLEPDSPKTRMVADIVEEMAVAARIPRPRLCLMEDPSPNAFAAGRDPAHSVICVTRGLVDQLDREELQAVIAHEMAHIRGHDTRLAQMAAVMVGGLALVAGSMWRTRNSQGGREALPKFGLAGLVIFIVGGVGWLFSKAAAIGLSRQREYLADASAVEFTRNPVALIRALEHIARIQSPLRPSLRAMAPLFIVDPFECRAGSWTEYLDEVARIEAQPDKSKVQRDAEVVQYMAKGQPRNYFQSMLSSHPPIHDRMARLRALVPGTADAAQESEAEIRARRRAAARTINEITAGNPEAMAAAIEALLKAKSSPQQVPSPDALRRESTEQEQPEPAVERAERPFGLTADRLQSQWQPSPSVLPSRAGGPATLKYMFWIVIALCAGAIAAALAVR